MNDLIYRQDAIDAAWEIIKRDDSGDNVVVQSMIAWREFIKSIPAVDAKEHIKGEWIVLNGEVVCSRCFEPNLETDYCPTCGADMREEGNDRDCPICIHKKKDGCESWECNYERRF